MNSKQCSEFDRFLFQKLATCPKPILNAVAKDLGLTPKDLRRTAKLQAGVMKKRKPK